MGVSFSRYDDKKYTIDEVIQKLETEYNELRNKESLDVGQSSSENTTNTPVGNTRKKMKYTNN